eukprot:8548544-Lingulodinium_polyedra.AAC.1
MTSQQCRGDPTRGSGGSTATQPSFRNQQTRPRRLAHRTCESEHRGTPLERNAARSPKGLTSKAAP